jgi:hypothetical protein
MERSAIRVVDTKKDPAFPQNSGVPEFCHRQFAQVGNIRLAPLMRATLAATKSDLFWS